MKKNTKSFSQGNYFKKLALILLSFIFFISCSNDETDPIISPTPEEIKTSIDITIDNEKFKISNSAKEYNGIITSNESCNSVFANCVYENDGNLGFRIDFKFKKNGALKKITLIDYKNGNILYESADFNPKGLITISNFEYDQTKKYFHFDFKGELLEQASIDELDLDKKRKHIEGTVKVVDLISFDCPILISDLNFETSDLTFLNSWYYGRYSSFLLENQYQISFYSDNGYRVVFKSPSNLVNEQKGTYTFDESSIERRIDFEKYIGNFRVSPSLTMRDVDWKRYQTIGTYTILDHKIINGWKLTKVEFNLQVYDEGILKYNIENTRCEIFSEIIQ